MNTGLVEKLQSGEQYENSKFMVDGCEVFRVPLKYARIFEAVVLTTADGIIRLELHMITANALTVQPPISNPSGRTTVPPSGYYEVTEVMVVSDGDTFNQAPVDLVASVRNIRQQEFSTNIYPDRGSRIPTLTDFLIPQTNPASVGQMIVIP